MIGERDYMRNGGGGARSNLPWANWSAIRTLLTINVCIFLACSIDKNVGDKVVECMALSRDALSNYKFWCPFTYMFTHQTFMHIFGNLWSLWLFGGLIENVLGKPKTFMLYIFSGLIGAGTWLLANWWSSAPYVRCIGASGSVFGFMVAAAMAFPDVKLQLLFPPVSLKMRTFAILYCLYEIYAEYGMNQDNIAHLAHLGGALGGFIFMRALLGKSSRRNKLRFKFLNSILKRMQSASHAQKPSGDSPDELDSDEVDRVLDKLAATGRSSLTPEETALLEKASRWLRDR